jgi:hypothetical protein
VNQRPTEYFRDVPVAYILLMWPRRELDCVWAAGKMDLLKASAARDATHVREMRLECRLRPGQLCGIIHLARPRFGAGQGRGLFLLSSREHVTLLLEKRKSRVYHGASLDRWRRVKRRDHSLTHR